MSLLLIILVLLILFSGGIGFHQGWGTPYGTGGIGIGTILVIVLLFLLFTGRL
jgi:hypothetical protein